MITMREIFDKAMALMDEYSTKGVRIDESKTADMRLKAILFADMAQKELYSVLRTEKTFTFTNVPAQPITKEWIPITLPADFMDLSQLVSESVTGVYNSEVSFKWEFPNTLYIDASANVTYRLVYEPIPVDVISIDSVLLCNAIVGQAIVYYVAAKLAPFENQSLTDFYEQKYIEMKFQLSKGRKATWEKVKGQVFYG